MGTPCRGEQLDDVAAVQIADRVVVTAPAPAHALAPGLRYRVVAEALLDEGDEVEQTRSHQVVQHLPLVLHLPAESPRGLELTCVDRLDRAIHRGAGQL